MMSDDESKDGPRQEFSTPHSSTDLQIQALFVASDMDGRPLSVRIPSLIVKVLVTNAQSTVQPDSNMRTKDADQVVP